MKRTFYDFSYNLRNSGKKKEKQKEEKNKKSKKEESDDENEIDLSGMLTGKGDKETKIERDGNHIYFYSEVNRTNVYELISLIREAEEENLIIQFKMKIDKIPIYLHINSFGGCIFSAFTAIDVIKSCKSPIYSIIEGSSASAGTIISIVAEKRYICPSSYMLIHQLSSGCWGKMSEIEDEFKNLTELMDKIKKIYTDHTDIPKKELNEILKHDLWLNSEKCLKYGLVDEIWKN
jgi:ATP-dependent Clp protease protease subunit